MTATSENCPQCAAPVNDAGVAPGGPLRCDKCGTRFPKAKRPVADTRNWTVRDDAEGLGIHPALAKKHRDRMSSPPAESDVDSDVSAAAESSPFSRAYGQAHADGAAPPKKETRVLADAPPSAERADDLAGREPGTTNPGRPAPKRSMVAPPPASPPPPPRAEAPSPSPRKKAEPPADPVPVIPGYACTELVGKGAMGRVYRARQASSSQWAAIKILAPELAARQDFIQRFEREGAAMRAVNHAGVVAVMDAGAARQPDGSTAHYICMEFVEGPPLRKHLDRGALTAEKALRYARLIIQGLGAAHARGVIHRDLKPENILVSPPVSGAGSDPGSAERLVLVDFGLAGILDEENDPHPNLTKSRMTMGTVNYMAPEQRTDAKRVDQRADLYAAGVILYELITGDLPLGRFALPTERGVPVPKSVDTCLIRALARNPEERYQQAAQFDDDLKAIEGELLRTSGQDTIVGRARTHRREALVEPGFGLGPGPGLVPATSGGPRSSLGPAGPAWVMTTLYWAMAALMMGTLLGFLVLLKGSCLP